MEMIIEFYTVNIFVKETFITSVGPGRAEAQKMARFRGLVEGLENFSYNLRRILKG
jgi:hypothetical protein